MTTSEHCMICLTNLQPGSRFVPELNCSCTILVHEECWNQWSGICLYCRREVIIYPDQRPRPYFRCLITCDEPAYAFLVWLALVLIYKLLNQIPP